MEHRLMTFSEKMDISMQSHKLREEGREEEASVLYRTIPLAPYMAKCAVKYLGVDGLLQMGWNLAEAEAEFGQDWLTQ